MITWNCVIFILFKRLLLEPPSSVWNTGVILDIIVVLCKGYSNYQDPVHKRNLFHALFGCRIFGVVTICASVVILV